MMKKNKKNLYFCLLFLVIIFLIFLYYYNILKEGLSDTEYNDTMKELNNMKNSYDNEINNLEKTIMEDEIKLMKLQSQVESSTSDEYEDIGNSEINTLKDKLEEEKKQLEKFEFHIRKVNNNILILEKMKRKKEEELE